MGKKRFAVTIIGKAEHSVAGIGSKMDFQEFYLEHKQEIEDALNSLPGIRVKSSLSQFELDDAIGQVQES